MVTGLVDQLLAVGGETGADVRHDLHFDVHSEVQFLKDLLLPPHRGCPLFIVKFVLLCARFESFDSSIVDPDHLHTLGPLALNDPVIDQLDLLVPIVKAGWGYPSSKPWFWRTRGDS